MVRYPKAVWRSVRRLVSLVHDDQDVREIYGDNPNGVTEDERLGRAAVITFNAASTFGR